MDRLQWRENGRAIMSFSFFFYLFLKRWPNHMKVKRWAGNGFKFKKEVQSYKVWCFNIKVQNRSYDGINPILKLYGNYSLCPQKIIFYDLNFVNKTLSFSLFNTTLSLSLFSFTSHFMCTLYFFTLLEISCPTPKMSNIPRWGE
jgi:hypothetical protein